jgi:hypothetical protein
MGGFAIGPHAGASLHGKPPRRQTAFQDAMIEPTRRGRPLQARPIAVDGVGDKNAGAHDAEECGDSFKHGVDP